MKTFQKLVIATIASTVLMSATAFAQVGFGKRAPQRQNVRAKLLSQLNLTADQKAKIKAIENAAKAKVQPIRRNAALTPQQKREQIKPILQDSQKQVMAILTPAQRKQLKELRKEARAKRQNALNPGMVKG